VRYKFWGKRIMERAGGLPFALPTAVAGITLATLYAEMAGWPLVRAVRDKNFLHMDWNFCRAHIYRLPFVVRTCIPVWKIWMSKSKKLPRVSAQIAENVRRIIIPMLFPSLLTGFALAFARAAGEYGSVPFHFQQHSTQNANRSLLIMSSSINSIAGATALAVVMLVISFLLLFAINILHGAPADITP